MSLPPRFPITPVEIDWVVARFYTAVRADPQMGPIFAAHVTDWPSHEAKIARFWRNAILFEREYDGNPMQTHINAGDIAPRHFGPWLALFDRVLAAELEKRHCDGLVRLGAPHRTRPQLWTGDLLNQ